MSYKDLNNETKALMQELGKQSPELMQAFQGLHQSATKSGALDTKTKELIALSLSVKAQCNRCIGMHLGSAKRAGASDAEIVEAIGVAALMGGGPALMYAVDALKALKDLS